MLKFKEIGNYKNAVNVGFCAAEVELHNGMVVEFDKATKKAKLPTTATAAGLAIVMNNIDKPETESPNDYVIEVGEYPRLFVLESLKDRMLSMDCDQIATAYASISVGDCLVPKTNGTWEKNNTTSSYPFVLKVIEKNNFGGEGEGLLVQVVAG